MRFDLLSSLYLMGLAQGLLLVVAFSLKKPLTKPAFILAFLVFVITGGMWEGFVLTSKLYTHYPGLFGWFIATPFIIGPTVYAYTLSLSEEHRPNLRFLITHGAVALVYFGFMLPYVIEPPQMKLVRIQAAMELPLTKTSVWNLIIILAKTAHLVVYLMLSQHVLKNWRARLRQVSSDNSQLKLDFLSRLFWYFMLVQLSFLVMILVKEFEPTWIPVAIDNIAYLVMIVFLFAIGYWGLTSPSILFDRLPAPANAPTEAGLSPLMVHEVTEKLRAALEGRKLYRNKALRLQHVADETGFSTHIISRIINEQFGMPFLDWINGYRVEEAKRLLIEESSKDFTIERIAHQSGFNNKVSFYKQFRESVGCSPAEFRKKNSLEPSKIG